MQEIDRIAFGQRVRERREELEWGQQKLADEAGYSQTNIGWIEKGRAKDPRKQALRLAEALSTTTDWLLYERGPKTIGPYVMSREQLRAAYDDLPAEAQLEVRELMTQVVTRYGRKKKQA